MEHESELLDMVIEALLREYNRAHVEAPPPAAHDRYGRIQELAANLRTRDGEVAVRKAKRNACIRFAEEYDQEVIRVRQLVDRLLPDA